MLRLAPAANNLSNRGADSPFHDTTKERIGRNEVDELLYARRPNRAINGEDYLEWLDMRIR